MRDLRWKDGDKIEIHAGAGEDAGKVQLVPGLQGFTLRLASAKSTRFQLKCMPWDECPDEHALVEAEYGINAATKTLTVHLPWSADSEQAEADAAA